MNLLSEAKAILLEADRQLKALLLRAVDEKRYAELSAISALAQSLSTIGADPVIDERQREVSAETSAASVPDTNTPHASIRTYPHFRRDGGKLVKVGWSKKERRSYEHRAPKEMVSQLARELTKRVDPGAAFKMEDFVPLRGAKGKELPTYQAYLALAWFRSIGIVQENGKLGYKFREYSLTSDKIEAHWSKLPVI